MSNKQATRRTSVTPSVFKSETFIFGLLVLSLAVILPLTLSRYDSTTSSTVALNGTTVLVPAATSSVPGGAVPLLTPAVPQPQATTESTSRPAPITYLLPYLFSLLAASLRLVARLPVIAYGLGKVLVIRPLSYPFALILAILRPLTLLLEILYILTLKTPFAIIAWFVREAVYPLYVFTGVAVLLGAAVGLGASQVPKGVQSLALRIRASYPTPPPSSRAASDIKTPRLGTSRRATAGIGGRYGRGASSSRANVNVPAGGRGEAEMMRDEENRLAALLDAAEISGEQGNGYSGLGY